MSRPSLRFVFDTNVLVSIAISRGTNLIHLFNTMEDYGVLLYSDEMLLELQSVLARPKFPRYLSPEARVNFLQRYDRLRTYPGRVAGA